MNEMEREVFINRINGMTQEEQEIAVTCIHTDLLWDELRRREMETRAFKQRVEEFVSNR